MSECSHDCSNCAEKCEKRDFHVDLHKKSSVKKVIGIISGKGGVGKSLVTSLLASKVCKDGFKSAILDADITGPSIPESFGVGAENATAVDGEDAINPVVTQSGIQLMSMNFLLEEETQPVIWRGPVIAGAVKQFCSDVIWQDVDFMFVDMPPGTGDVPLTVFQSLPVDGIVIVTSPQELVQLIVKKAVNMAEMMDIPVLGVVENYSYLKCPDCGKEIKIFGESHIDEAAAEMNMEILGKMPLDPDYAKLADDGLFHLADNPYLDKAVNVIEKM